MLRQQAAQMQHVGLPVLPVALCGAKCQMLDHVAGCGQVHGWELMPESLYIVLKKGLCHAAACCCEALDRRGMSAWMLLQVLAMERQVAKSCKQDLVRPVRC